MSLSKMSVEERASYFVGQVVRRHIEGTPWSVENEQTIDVLKKWVKRWLTPDEWDHVKKVMVFSEQLGEPPHYPGEVPF
jgi:hypothetical protein